jgi:hypothetical protein
MTSIGFVAWLKKFITRVYSWLKITLTDADNGNTIEINGDNVTQITDFGDLNNIVINNNKIVNIILNEKDPTFNRHIFNELLENLGSGIDNHEGYGISFDNGVSVIRFTKLLEPQKEAIKIFKRAGWPEDLLNALSIAFKIINLEDNGKYDNAKTLMNGALNGKFGQNIRKLYNLARAGYIDGFVMDTYFSPASYGAKWILETLNYFPNAIFVDDNSSMSEIIEALSMRQVKEIKKVSLFARGRKIETLMAGYSGYIDKNVGNRENKERPPFHIYIISENEDYTIGWSRAKRLVLKLETVREASSELLQKWASDLSKA